MQEDAPRCDPFDAAPARASTLNKLLGSVFSVIEVFRHYSPSRRSHLRSGMRDWLACSACFSGSGWASVLPGYALWCSGGERRR
jgi:hypothetical protein